MRMFNNPPLRLYLQVLKPPVHPEFRSPTLKALSLSPVVLNNPSFPPLRLNLRVLKPLMRQEANPAMVFSGPTLLSPVVLNHPPFPAPRLHLQVLKPPLLRRDVLVFSSPTPPPLSLSLLAFNNPPFQTLKLILQALKPFPCPEVNLMEFSIMPLMHSL